MSGGVVFPSGGQAQVEITIVIDESGQPVQSYRITDMRFDIWPQWLGLALTEHDAATVARAANPGPGEGPQDEIFRAGIIAEMRPAMTSICAIAFAVEAFTNSVTHQRPDIVVHASGAPGAPASDLPKPPNAYARVHQVWQRAFLLGNNAQSKGIKDTLRQLYKFRDAAVHSSAGFAMPVPHGMFDVQVEERFSMFRVENSHLLCRWAKNILPFLLLRPRGTDEPWLAWCQAMSEVSDAS